MRVLTHEMDARVCVSRKYLRSIPLKKIADRIFFPRHGGLETLLFTTGFTDVFT